MSYEEAFLRAICEQPDDNTPRLIFADWLEERGHPGDADRAEFIPLQCWLASPGDISNRSELEKREKELLDRHRKEWEQPLSTVARLAGLDQKTIRTVLHGKQLPCTAASGRCQSVVRNDPGRRSTGTSTSG